MSLLTSYSSKNFVLVDDYSYRCNQIDSGEPIVAVELSTTSSTPPERKPVVTITQWWRATIEETASFKYIGMDYSTAKDCADAMRSLFTFTSYPWVYSEYLSGDYLLYGWHKGTGTPTLESEISLEKHDNGCMYDVVVNAKCTTINYDKGANALDLNDRPLANAIDDVPGWDSTHQLSGHHFDAAGSSNIALLVAPTYKTKFELVGQQVVTTNKTNLSGFSIDDWYKATTDWQAQIKYEGMTKTACRTLFNSLNSTTGWYLSSNPWEYFYDIQTSSLGWHPNTEITQWQCLNQYKATENEGGMFTAELTLHAQLINMTKDPAHFTTPSYPSFWRTRIPGLSSFL